jgi:hypothetical protein
MTEKLADLYRETRKVVIKLNQAKAMHTNNKNKNTFILDRKNPENIDMFPDLACIVAKKGGRMEDVRNKISKVNGAFNKL